MRPFGKLRVVASGVSLHYVRDCCAEGVPGRRWGKTDKGGASTIRIFRCTVARVVQSTTLHHNFSDGSHFLVGRIGSLEQRGDTSALSLSDRSKCRNQRKRHLVFLEIQTTRFPGGFRP